MQLLNFGTTIGTYIAFSIEEIMSSI